MGFNCGFLRWAGVVQFARGRGRDDSKTQGAVFFFVLQHLKMQLWASTASWSPFHLSRREIHTTTSRDPETLGWSLPQTEPFSSLCSGPLQTRLKFNSFLASPSDSALGSLQLHTFTSGPFCVWVLQRVWESWEGHLSGSKPHSPYL